MDIRELVKAWFDKWEAGDFLNLPISDEFTHTSPFGKIEGKRAYIDLVKANKEKFLGYRFEILSDIYGDNKACVRYRAIQGDFSLDVSEWYFVNDDLIDAIVSYYHMGEIPDHRKLKSP